MNASVLRSNCSNYSNRALAAADGNVVRVSDQVENVIAMYISPLVVLLGLVGNVLNILILFKRRARGSSTRTLLCCLSAMDTLVLLVQVPYILMAYVDWFDARAFMANAFYVCCIRYPLSNVGLSAVAWLSAAVSIDRFASIMNVHRLRRFLKHHAKLLAIAIVLISCLLNVFRVLQFRPVDSPPDEHYNQATSAGRRRMYCQQTALTSGTMFGSVMDYLSGILNTLLPTLCMLLFGGVVIVKLLRLKRTRRMLFMSHSTPSQSPDQNELRQYSKVQREQEQEHEQEQCSDSDRLRRSLCSKVSRKESSVARRLNGTGLSSKRFSRTDKRISLATKMVVATISLFVLSGLPSLILTTASAIFGRSIYQYEAVNCLRHISNLLIFINVSFCFLLYCCTSSKYRRAVRKLLRGRNRRRAADSSRETTENATNANGQFTTTNVSPSETSRGLLGIICNNNRSSTSCNANDSYFTD